MFHHTIVRQAPAPRLESSRPARLRLEPAAALPRYSAVIAELAERCRLPNPFFLPEFLGPAIEALGGGAVELALVADGDGRLLFFAPLSATGFEAELFGAARVWTHPFAPLGVPLIDLARAEEALAALVDGLAQAGRRVLVLPDVPVDVPEMAVLRRYVQALGHRAITTAPSERRVLRADRPGGAQAFRAMVSRKKRKELARQLRRLSDIAPVSFATFRRADEITAAMEAFLAVEAAGWKGRRGTAMAQDPALMRFALSIADNLSSRSGVAIDAMFVGDRPAAALVRLQAGGLSVPWKIAYDEAFAPFSPGAQLMSHASRAWLTDPAVTRVDPVCDADNALLVQLWDERETYATLVLATGPATLLPHLVARACHARHAARRLARRAAGAVASARPVHKRRTP